MIGLDPPPRRILVRTPNWIGDQIMAYPFFHRLREVFPAAHVAALCVPWVADIQFRNLVDDVITLPMPPRRGLILRMLALEEGGQTARRHGPWDLGISLPNSLTSAWHLYRSGARQRWGYTGDGRSVLLTHTLPADESLRHRADVYLRLLPASLQPPWEAADFWTTGPAAADKGVLGRPADAAWADFSPLACPQERFWLLAPGAVADARRWPTERFLDLARRIVQETGLRGLVVGGPGEAAVAQAICAGEPRGMMNWTALGPIPVLRDLFRQAVFTVSNDSGLAHVASFCGSRVQVICGAGDPRRTRPIGPGSAGVLSTPLPCWPCERNTCPRTDGGRNECLGAISVDAVWNSIRTGLPAA